jgi:hypothetical protein
MTHEQLCRKARAWLRGTRLVSDSASRVGKLHSHCAPLKQIAQNAGKNGDTILDKVLALVPTRGAAIMP